MESLIKSFLSRKYNSVFVCSDCCKVKGLEKLATTVYAGLPIFPLL